MRERSVGARAHIELAGGGARMMVRWLWAAAALLATANAWRPPPHAVPLTSPRLRRTTHTTHNLQLMGWHLELQENRAIRSPYYTECQFYRGYVLNEEFSSATVTECGGQLYGLLDVAGEEFVVQPERGSKDGHLLRRRDTLFAERPLAHNLTGDTVSDLDFSLEDEDPLPHTHVRARHSSRDDIEYFQELMTVTRPLSGVQGLWLEMAIVADHTMLKFHGRERVKHYILALMNIVSAIFNDPTLNSNMTLIINKLYLYEEKDSVIKFGNVKKTLEAVNKWNYRHLMKLPADSTGWDAAVWLTRAELGGPSGFAPVGGVCSRTRSAAIDRDEGLTSAFVIAHELAHLLGLTHDGENDCKTASLHRSVMAPTVLATLHNYTWSTCSKKQFHEKSIKWWCLQERSGDEGVELGGARGLSNYVFTMDEQCRTEFGEGFSVCKSVRVKSACSRLWCAHKAMPHVCRSKRAPPIEGTPCGHNQWCVHRVCEPMPGQGTVEVAEEPAPPAWDVWSEWTACSADCGYGLKMRHRRCLYKGSVTETGCEGAASQTTTCWAGGACADTRDVHADLCFRMNTSLIPFVQDEESKYCELWCVEYSGGEPSSFGAVPDGTSCSYSRPYDVCYQGTCVKGQCNSSDPVCNWCPDGFCNNNTHYYTRQLSKGWTRITVIPHEANLLNIRIITPISLHIALRERRRDRHILELSNHRKNQFDIQQNTYLKYDPNVPQNLQIIEVDSNVIDTDEKQGWEGSVVAGGTLLKWRQTDTDVSIKADSRLQTDLMVLAIPGHSEDRGDHISVEVSVSYSTPSPGVRTRPLEYRWSTERGPCSVTCGGGLRVVRPRCVLGEACAPVTYEQCNVHSCEFTWWGGEWEECSATCGGEGVQERQLFCVPSSADTSILSRRELIRHSVSPVLCTGAKPDKVQPCNRLPCPVYWQEMPWTPCSTTCGRGYSYRPLTCPAEDDMLCGLKPRERKRRCRLRRCLQPKSRPICPETDATQYCELFTVDQLKRNCVIPPFRKYCCNACKNADDIENTV